VSFEQPATAGANRGLSIPTPPATVSFPVPDATRFDSVATCTIRTGLRGMQPAKTRPIRRLPSICDFGWLSRFR